MDMYAILGIGIVAAVLAVVLRQYKPEYAMFISLGCSVLILLAVVGQIDGIMRQLEVLIIRTRVPVEFVAILFKALGICIITQMASDTCKDAGEGAIASKLELAGKVAVLVISLPLFTHLIDIAGALFSL